MCLPQLQEIHALQIHVTVVVVVVEVVAAVAVVVVVAAAAVVVWFRVQDYQMQSRFVILQGYEFG